MDIILCPLKDGMMTLTREVMERLDVRPGMEIAIVRKDGLHFLCSAVMAKTGAARGFPLEARRNVSNGHGHSADPSQAGDDDCHVWTDQEITAACKELRRVCNRKRRESREWRGTAPGLQAPGENE